MENRDNSSERSIMGRFDLENAALRNGMTPEEVENSTSEELWLNLAYSDTTSSDGWDELSDLFDR